MKRHHTNPPRFGDWLLKILARYEVNPHLRGDFSEEYSQICDTEGIFLARLWYWTHLLRSLPVFIKDFFHRNIPVITMESF